MRNDFDEITNSIIVLEELARVVLNVLTHFYGYWDFVMEEKVLWMETPWFSIAFFDRYRHDDKVLYGWQMIGWKINWAAKDADSIRVQDFAMHRICDLAAT